MKGTPIYLKSLYIKGIKTLDADVILSLTRNEETLPQWTVILGDNGIGKSTLLHTIAWLKPILPYSVDDSSEDFKPEPIINDEENEVLEKLVSRHHKVTDPAHMRVTYIANQLLREPYMKKGEQICEASMTIRLNKQGKLEDVKSSVNTKYKGVFYKNEVVIFGYSASRQLGKLNLNDNKLQDSIPGFIKEKTVLYDAEEILHTLNYSALGAKQIDKRKYENFIGRVKAMLVKILPDFEAIDDIEITPPSAISGDFSGGILISTKHGKKIPFNDFSLGYKTVVSWTIDLAWRMFNKYQGISNDPLKEPAIVLVDEIDLHLHPKWQREIMFNLSEHFPNVQFIATAHSPLMIQAAIESNYAVLRFENGSVRLLNEPKTVDGWRVDQILTSELFGLQSSRGLKYDNLIKERNTILAKSRLSNNDKQKIESIDKQIKSLPTGENIEDMETRKAIAEVIKEIKEKKIKLDL